MAQDLPPSGGYEPIQYKVSPSIPQSVLPTRPRPSSLPVSNAPNPSPYHSTTTRKEKTKIERGKDHIHTYIHGRRKTNNPISPNSAIFQPAGSALPITSSPWPSFVRMVYTRRGRRIGSTSRFGVLYFVLFCSVCALKGVGG